MSRPLVAGLLAEGATDELFLGTVISRQLREITQRSARCPVDVERTEIGSCRTIKDLPRVVSAAVELAADCHLIFVHNDHRERDKAARIAQAVADQEFATPMLPLVPVRETEAWLVADHEVWRALKGSRLEALPDRPKNVERIVDPKAVLASVIPQSGRNPMDYYFNYAAQNVDLAVLAQVEAYALWVKVAEDALKELRYL